MMKRKIWKVLCMTLCILFALSSVAFAAQTTIVAKDVKGFQAEKQINAWIAKGFLTIAPDGAFRPYSGMARSDLAKIVNKAFGFTVKAAVNYKDVKIKDVFYSDMAVAKQAGYLAAKADGTIAPKGFITRLQFAVLIQTLLKMEQPTQLKAVNSLKDAGSIPVSGRNAVEVVLNKGFMTANANKAFNPNGIVTRVEAIVALDKVYLHFVRIAYDKVGIFSAKTVDGSVQINVSGVTLQNTVINGDLIIAKSVGNGNVKLKNVTVKGDTVIKGGGTSISIENSKLGHVIIAKAGNNVKVVIAGNTTTGTVDMQSGGMLEESGVIGMGFGSITVAESVADGAPVTLSGQFENVTIQGNFMVFNLAGGSIGNLHVASTAGFAKISLGNGSSVVNLVLDAVSTVTGNGTIGSAKVNVVGSIITAPTTYIDTASGITVSTSLMIIPEAIPAGAGDILPTPAPATETPIAPVPVGGGGGVPVTGGGTPATGGGGTPATATPAPTAIPTPTATPTTPTPSTTPTPTPTPTPPPTLMAGTIQFNSTSVTAAEAAGTIFLTVVRTGGSNGIASVDYAVTGGTASGAGVDCTLNNGTVTFADGDAASKTIAIVLINDTLIEPDETVVISLSNVQTAALGANQAMTLTITSEDAVGSLQFDPAAVTASETAGTTSLTVTRTGGSVGIATADYAMTGGTATGGGVDYLMDNGTVSFADGEMGSKAIAVTLINDLLVEPDKTVIVTLSNATTATMGTNTIATLNITSEDLPPFTSIADLAASSGNGEAVLDWTPPVNATSVVLQVKEFSLPDTSFSKAAYATSDANMRTAGTTTATGLTNGILYTFRLAVSGGSNQGNSNTADAFPLIRPDAGAIPITVNDVNGNKIYDAGDRLTITFNAPVSVFYLTTSGVPTLVLGTGDWDASVITPQTPDYSARFTITLSNANGNLLVNAGDTITIDGANVISSDGTTAFPNIVFTLPVIP